MNLSGYVVVDHGHAQGDVFRIISAHIVGMYGLVLVVGDLIDRVGPPARDRRRAARSWPSRRSRSCGSTRSSAMSVALFGLGLGWSFSYVAATAELVTLAGVFERGRLVGFTDLVAGSRRPRSCSSAAPRSPASGRSASRSAGRCGGRPGARAARLPARRRAPALEPA